MEELKPDEALAQISYLREIIEETRLRAASGWFHYLVWGIAWVVGYIVTGLSYSHGHGLPHPSGLSVAITWIAVSVGALVVTGIPIGASFTTTPTALGRKLAGLNITFFLAISGFYAYIASNTHLAIIGFFPFWIGVLYIANAIFIGSELFWIGGWLIAAAVASVFMPDMAASFFLAAAGGGGLVATGIVFRRQLRSGS